MCVKLSWNARTLIMYPKIHISSVLKFVLVPSSNTEYNLFSNVWNKYILYHRRNYLQFKAEFFLSENSKYFLFVLKKSSISNKMPIEMSLISSELRRQEPLFHRIKYKICFSSWYFLSIARFPCRQCDQWAEPLNQCKAE